GVHLKFSGHYRGINELEKVGLSGRLPLLIVIYDYISGIINKLSNKLQEETDRKEAIKILEANQLKVGLILSELPLD
ncbi:hypothetical protein KTH92_19330, partial [Acinetobacter baumannii]|nr:hypothetical protein [Acinetobacter baumannii]